LLKIAITLLVFWFVFRGVDFANLREVLRHQDKTILILGGFLLLVQLVIGAFRWDIILRALSDKTEAVLSKSKALKIYYISTFFTCCLPGAVGGDVVRVWLTKSQHISLPVSINSVVIDRMIALFALVIMVMLTMPILGSALGFSASLILPLVTLAIVMGVIFIFYAEKILSPFKSLRIVHWILHLVAGIRLILKKPKSSFVALAMALIGQVVYSVVAWVLACSLSINMSLTQSITLMPPVMLATMLPISIGGWGVREVGIIGMLGIIGVPQASALLLSLQLGLLGVVISLPGSLFWLGDRKKYSHSIMQPPNNPSYSNPS